MNKIDKKVKEYLDRALNIANKYDYYHSNKISEDAYLLFHIEIAKMIQREKTKND
jgi:hypothetical protein